MITTIELKNLEISKLNVRVVSPTKEKDKELISSLEAHGVLQNLIVIPGKGKKYQVIAGGRRLAALKHLHDKGTIKNNYPVPCVVDESDNATVLSLAENIKAPMHPADEFSAYQKMVTDGKSVKDIAGEFGVSQNQVKKRLKLAGISLVLVDYYRAGKLTLDQVMAFTVSDDHDKQLACYKELSPHYLHPHRIKNFLLDQAVLSDHGMVKLVTLDAYKKAGGITTSDLFESVTYVNDRELLESLAKETLDQKRESLLGEGWKWAEIALNHHDLPNYATQINAELAGVPEELTAALKQKTTELDDLNEKDYEDWTKDDDDLESSLYEDIEKLENEQEAYRVFTDSQKSVSGVIVSYGSGGDITVELGCVKKEDLKEAFPPSSDNDGGDGDNEFTNSDNSIESQALLNDLNNFRLQAMHSEIMKHDDLCYELLVFSLARRVLGEYGYYRKVLDISCPAQDMSATKGIEETLSAVAINEFKNALDISWLGFESEGDKFKAFRALSRAQKKHILSYCVASGFMSDRSSGIESLVLETLNFDIFKHWKPTKDNYFSRVKKDDLLLIGEERIGRQWRDDHVKTVKGQLVDLLEASDQMFGWMPKSLIE